MEIGLFRLKMGNLQVVLVISCFVFVEDLGSIRIIRADEKEFCVLHKMDFGRVRMGERCAFFSLDFVGDKKKRGDKKAR